MNDAIFFPNLHVAIVHFPIALLVAGVLIEIFSLFFGKGSLRSAGRWMILLGAVAGLPTAASGLNAYYEILRINNPNDENGFHALRAGATMSDAARALIERHILVQAVASVVAILLVTLWIGLSDIGRRKWHAILLGLMIIIVGGVGYGSWLAGEAVYRHRLPSPVTEPQVQTHAPVDATLQSKALQVLARVERKIPPMELHTYLAGLTIALGIVSIGLAFRQMSGYVAVTPAPANAAPSDPLAMVRSINPDATVMVVDTPPAARFWLLAMLLAILTALTGAWFLASDADAFTAAKAQGQSVVKYLWEMIRPATNERLPRRFAHLVGAGALIGLPLLLAIIARLLPRRKMLLSLFSLLLIVVMIAQVWIGMLLLFDTSEGTIFKINPPTTQATTQP